MDGGSPRCPRVRAVSTVREALGPHKRGARWPAGGSAQSALCKGRETRVRETSLYINIMSGLGGCAVVLAALDMLVVLVQLIMCPMPSAGL
jgi:hypothetical protein